MSKLHLTSECVSSVALTTSGQVLYWDTELPCFGLRVGTRRKTFFVEKRANGRVVRATIGVHPIFSVDEARAKALAVLGDLSNGIDVNATKKIEKATRNAVVALAIKGVSPANVGRLDAALIHCAAPGEYGDGAGLLVRIGRKRAQLVFRYTSVVTRSRREMGLGSFNHFDPEESKQALAVAREVAEVCRTIVRAQRDPIDEFARKRLFIRGSMAAAAQRADLHTGYVKKLLARAFGVDAKDIPEEVVVMKREQVGLHRLAKEMQQVANHEKEHQ